MAGTADISVQGMVSDQIGLWEKALVPVTALLGEVIRNLDSTTLQIAMVVSPDGTLIGTVTDGDIRRGLLRGLDLNSPIDSVIHKEPLVAPPQMGRDMVMQLMQANKILQLPVVDSDRKVKGLYLWDNIIIPDQKPNIMIIMAGGQGVRLRPHTESCPKPLLPVGGKPMLEHIIERAKREGFVHFVLAVCYLGHMIEDYFGDGSKWQVKIEYLKENDPLGTAGALSMLNFRPSTPIIVSNGDVLSDIHYGELLDFHCRHLAMATMAVRQHEWQHPYGVVCINGVDIVGFEEKPISRSHINAGVYILEPIALNYLKPNEHCDMPTLFTRLKSVNHRTIVYPMYEPWLDVGRSDDLSQANIEYLSKTRNKDHE